MPTYEYECDMCQLRFEKRQGFYDSPVVECPRCQGICRRVFHPAPIIFKGSGFYVTDSRQRAGGDGDGGGDGSDAGGGDSGSPAKRTAPAGESAEGDD